MVHENLKPQLRCEQFVSCCWFCCGAKNLNVEVYIVFKWPSMVLLVWYSAFAESPCTLKHGWLCSISIQRKWNEDMWLLRLRNKKHCSSYLALDLGSLNLEKSCGEVRMVRSWDFFLLKASTNLLAIWMHHFQSASSNPSQAFRWLQSSLQPFEGHWARPCLNFWSTETWK